MDGEPDAGEHAGAGPRRSPRDRSRSPGSGPRVELVRRVVGAAALALVLPGGSGAQPAPATLTPFAAHKAESLLREQLSCLGCHAFGDEGGRLAPDLRTARQRRSAAFIAAMVDDPQGTLPGSMMPRTTLPPATRDLVVRYLQAQPGSGTTVSPAAPPAPPGSGGTALYARWCASCHGTSGRGDGPNAARLPVKPAVHADAGAMGLRSDDALYDTIAGGGAIMNRSPRMPAFGETLSAHQIRSLVAEIRRLCRCEGPSWSVR